MIEAPFVFCPECQKKHSDWFWHCATELTWGKLATCNKCKTELDNVKNITRKKREHVA